ncbi:hypothetical protein BJF85_04525 [Saccharomonospora sp. CUA-673]|nr:hypothetical protein BJF85_04525 [Saccharomonospora sp. CUA-673]
MMGAPTVPFFAFERALLATPTEELPAAVDVEFDWPTVDMDDPEVEAERQRASEVAIHRSQPEQAPTQRSAQWQPPMTADELAHLLELMRKKWNM